MEGSLLRIGELAAMCSVSVKALRLYEKRGLIRPAYVDPQTGYRYYSVDQVHQARVLLELKSIGFSLDEIRGILSGETGADALCERLRRKRIAWQDAVTAAEYKISVIDRMLSAARQQGEFTGASVTEEERAWLLAKLVCVEELRSLGPISEAIWL